MAESSPESVSSKHPAPGPGLWPGDVDRRTMAGHLALNRTLSWATITTIIRADVITQHF